MGKKDRKDFLDSLFGPNIFPHTRPAVIAGPCSAESEEQVLRSARELLAIGIKVLRAGVWKPRTLPGGFEGYRETALGWLTAAKEKTGILIGTEIATAEQARLALEHHLDFVWIGARTTTSPFAIEEIGHALSGHDIPIFLKNPIAPDLALWHGALLRLSRYGHTKVIPVLRGFRLGDKGGLRNSPLWYLMREFRALNPSVPVFCDPSHIAGRADLLPEVIREASLQDYDGLMIESHPTPHTALTDAEQQVTPQKLRELLSAWADPLTSHHTPLYDFRQHLRVIDDELIRLVAEREQISLQIGKWKQENGVESFQSTQNEQMEEDRHTYALQHGADTKLVKALFRLIHQDSVAIQDHIKKNR